MGADPVTIHEFSVGVLAVLGLAGCAMILASVALDYVRPTKFNGWTLK